MRADFLLHLLIVALFSLGVPASCLAIGPYTASGSVIYDQGTGLVWQETSDTNTTRTWQQALDYCKSLHTTYSDWRVPNIRELSSLYKPGQSPAIDSVFSTGNTFYWSSTTLMDTDKSYAWTIDYNVHAQMPYGKSSSDGLVRCVRGGLTRSYRLAVTLEGTGFGSVTFSAPATAVCTDDCTMYFDARSMITLTARTEENTEFLGWSGEGCSGTGTCTVYMGYHRNVTATFSLKKGRAGTGPRALLLLRKPQETK